MQNENICIVGLGYVGMTLGVALADVGYKVIGIEKNLHIIDCLKQKKAHFSEVGLNEKLEEVIENRNFTFSSDINDAKQSTSYIITVGTPVMDDKTTNFSSINEVTGSLVELLNDDDIVILRSTVQVGTTENKVKPILDRSGKTYRLAFCPERTLEGKALLELSELPQIIGGLDEDSFKRAEQIFSRLAQEIVKVPDVKTAEIVKLINNTYRDYTFAFANEIAKISDALGISAVDAIQAANHNYPRSNVPIPGPVGGPCLEKDPYILSSSCEGTGIQAELSIAGRKLNEDLPVWTVDAVVEKFHCKSGKNPSSISICGTAFKGRPETSDLRGSMAFEIVRHIRNTYPEVTLQCWDPVTPVEELKALGVDICPTFKEACNGVDIVLIQNNHIYFTGGHIEEDINLLNPSGIVFDYWGKFYNRFTSLSNDIEYLILGSMNVKS